MILESSKRLFSLRRFSIIHLLTLALKIIQDTSNANKPNITPSYDNNDNHKHHNK